jgi:hypothetical protein
MSVMSAIKGVFRIPTVQVKSPMSYESFMKHEYLWTDCDTVTKHGIACAAMKLTPVERSQFIAAVEASYHRGLLSNVRY